MLFVDRCLLCVVRWFQIVICCVLFVGRGRFLYVVVCFAVRCLMCVDCCVLLVVECLL